MKTQETQILFEQGTREKAISVVVPLYNYEDKILETLDSVESQSCRDVCLIVVDDCSTDGSAKVVEAWMKTKTASNLSFVLARNRGNARLAVTRNTGISLSKSFACFFLDADNILLRRCLEKHLAALRQRSDAAAAYSLIEVFDCQSDVIGAGVFHRSVLRHGNYIDAMSMIRTDVLYQLDGYHHIEHGWEDYDLWLRFCETNMFAIHIPEILSRYREHKASMLRTQTNISENIRELRANIKHLHPWIDLH